MNIPNDRVSGYARVTNMRRSMAPDAQPEPGESVVAVDRSNPVLGNRHVLANRNDSVTRDRVIEAYGKDLEADFARSGPMAAAVHALAERVRSGERLCLACWCAPSRCHGDLIVKKINSINSLSKASKL